MASHELDIGGADSLVVGIIDRHARVDRTAFAGEGRCVLVRIRHPDTENMVLTPYVLKAIINVCAGT